MMSGQKFVSQLSSLHQLKSISKRGSYWLHIVLLVEDWLEYMTISTEESQMNDDCLVA
jgi:hypothetical protein